MLKSLPIITLITLISSGSSYAALIGHYSLDGNGTDSISNIVAPSININSAADRFGNTTGAVSLDGSTSIIQPLDVGINDASQDFPSLYGLSKIPLV